MKLKYILIPSLIMLLSACASAYKPTPNAMNLHKQMTFNKAAKTFKAAFLKSDLKRGICAANGIPGVSVLTNSKWNVYGKNPDFKINKQGFSVNAFQMAFHYSYNPQSATKTSTGSTRKDFIRSIKFSDIDTIMVRPNPGTMIRRCPRPDGHTEVTIELDDMGHWFTLIVKDEDVDQFVASVMYLAPQVKLTS